MAGEFLQEEYAGFQVIPNAPANISTAADRQSQEIILKHVHAAFPADAATVAGTVTGPDGTPFRAAFVQARNTAMKMTVSVLTDNQGRYVVEKLPARDYQLSIRAIGYQADPKSGVKLTADQNASHDFGLQSKMVDWTDLSWVSMLPRSWCTLS